MKWISNLIFGLSIAFGASTANANNDELFLLVCQEKAPKTGELIELVTVLEQVEPDGGNTVDIVRHPLATDDVEGILGFYRGNLQENSIEEIAVEANLLEEVRGEMRRFNTTTFTFGANDNGWHAGLVVDFEHLDRATYARADGRRALLLNCYPPTTVADAFPNRR